MMNIKANSKKAYKLMHDGVLALARAEQQGIRIDMDYCEKQKKGLTRRIIWAEKQFYETSFYRDWVDSLKGNAPNIYSPTQLGVFLYKVKRFKPANTTKSGAGATGEESLEQLDLPELQMLLTAKKLKKIRDTYLEQFVREEVNGYLHPSFALHLVRTFRSSSNNPNFQNIPKRDEEAKQITRGALFPRHGHQLLELDFGSLEVRIAACYHQDPLMLKYINDPSTDMHRDMAAEIFMMDIDHHKKASHKILRAATKNGFVFPEFYGDYYKNCAKSIACKWMGLSETCVWKKGMGLELEKGFHISDHFLTKGINNLEKFTKHVQDIEAIFWNDRFTVYNRWRERWWKLYQRKGYFDTLTGFRCSGVMGKNEVINYPVQGSAFHCLLWTLNALDSHITEKGLDTRIIGQIHDSVVLDVLPSERLAVVAASKNIACVELSRAWDWINVPLTIDFEMAGVDQSFAEMREAIL